MINIKGISDKDTIIKLIDAEYSSVTNTLAIQQGLNKQILLFFKVFVEDMNVEEGSDVEKIHQYIDDANFNLKKSKFNISSVEELLEKLEKIKNKIDTVLLKTTKTKISQYNKENADLMNKILINTTSINNFVAQISELQLSNLSKSTGNINIVESETSSVESLPDNNVDENASELKENVLLISEMKKQVTFPYKKEDLQELLEENPDKYDSLESVIKDKYTKPLSTYKFSAISRFREAYKLVVEKEKGSKLTAIELALELFSNYNLHPAIIAACKNLNELDVYLSCLEYDELNDFHFFKVNYEIAPTIIKHFPFSFKKNENKILDL